MIICETPFRISFFGGGTDWPEFFLENRGAVLGTTIDQHIYHAMTSFHSRLFDYSIRLAYRKVECVKTVDEIEHRAFREILRAFDITRDVEINLASDLPAFSGLGTSSSFSVGLIHTINAFQGRFISKHDLAYAAIQIERERLGECVGCQDQVFAAFGGFNVVEFHKPDDISVSRVVIGPDRMQELDESLLLYFTGITRSSQEIEREKMAGLERSRAVLKGMLNLVDRGHELLTSQRSLSAFGSLLDEAWRDKRALGPHVTNDRIDRMYERAKAAGALGGKLLGAGGGGFLLLFVPLDRQEAFRAQFADHYEVPFHINSVGSHIIHS